MLTPNTVLSLTVELMLITPIGTEKYKSHKLVSTHLLGAVSTRARCGG